MTDGYKGFGDLEVPSEPSKRDIQRQRQAERVREAVKRMQWHQYTAGESAGGFYSHTHENDGANNVHDARQAFSARAE